MKRIFVDADPDELIAWLRGVPVAVPPPPPKRATKSLSVTVMSRHGVVVLPANVWNETTLERK